MGQLASTATDNGAQIQLELFTKSQLLKLFHLRCLQLISHNEFSGIAEKFSGSSEKEPEKAPVSITELCEFLQLPEPLDLEPKEALETLLRALKVISRLPFLSDATASPLTSKELLISSVILLKRARSVLKGEFDYSRLIFIALAIASQEEQLLLEKQPELVQSKTLDDSSKNSVEDSNDQYSVEVVQPPAHLQTAKEDTVLCREIRWSTFAVLKRLDDVNVSRLTIPARKLVQVFALFLAIRSIPQTSHQKMFSHIEDIFSKKWDHFLRAAVLLVRSFSTDITSENWEEAQLSFDDFQRGLDDGHGALVHGILQHVFEHSLLVPDRPKKQVGSDKQEKVLALQESRLVNEATVALIALALQRAGVHQTVSTGNMIPLFNGSQEGFSLRSLETRIFKWRAPTVLLVSGKRLKPKTISTNRRYQQFEAEYPRYFRPGEQTVQPWQGEKERITYAVYVNVPWQSSNKLNFGDENCAIISILPRFDVFTSKKDPIVGGKLVYFNNLGMGLGFGNDQPVNKNQTRRFIPGNVSLTLEANLEFAIFRHIRFAGSNTASYYNTSAQEQVQGCDFEDRFMISDLEVWGVGSTKELEEQRRQWEWEEKQAKDRQGVNVRSMGEERAFLEMAGLVGNHGAV